MVSWKIKRVDLLLDCDEPEAHWIVEQGFGDRQAPYAMRTAPSQILYCSSGERAWSTMSTRNQKYEEITEPALRARTLDLKEGGPDASKETICHWRQ